VLQDAMGALRGITEHYGALCEVTVRYGKYRYFAYY